VTFNYGSTDPDVNLSLVAGEDFREYQTVYRTINCDAAREAGLDVSPIMDAGSDPRRDIGDDVVVRTDTSSPPDAGADTGATVGSDAGVPAGADTGAPLLPDAGLAADSAPPLVSPDASGTTARPDAGTHANPDPVPPEHRGGGCSVSDTSPAGDWILWALLVVGLACRACAGSRRRDRDRKVTG
jgi:hypothetical protein